MRPGLCCLKTVGDGRYRSKALVLFRDDAKPFKKWHAQFSEDADNVPNTQLQIFNTFIDQKNKMKLVK